MPARITNPVILIPDAMQALLALAKATRMSSVPTKTFLLIDLRASQINGCSVCVDMHARELKKIGESDERLFAVAAWRDSPYFSDAERAVLALTESATRASDRAEPVSDDVWNEAARHFDEPALAALTMEIGMINLWNRLNLTTRQVAGAW